MKKALFLLITCLLIASSYSCKKTSCPTPVTNNLTDSLILHYTFSGDAKDKSGKNNDGTFTSTPVFNKDRRGVTTSQSLYVDGIKSFVERNSLTQNLNKVTISAWFKPATSQQNSLVFYEGQSSSNGWGIIVYSGDPGVKGDKCKVLLGNVSKDVVNSNYSLPTGYWSHIVLTKEGKLFRLYANGVFIHSGEGVPNVFTSGKLSFGGNTNSAGTFVLNGDMDDTRVYSRILSDSDIMALYTE